MFILSESYLLKLSTILLSITSLYSITLSKIKFIIVSILILSILLNILFLILSFCSLEINLLNPDIYLMLSSPIILSILFLYKLYEKGLTLLKKLNIVLVLPSPSN